MNPNDQDPVSPTAPSPSPNRPVESVQQTGLAMDPIAQPPEISASPQPAPQLQPVSATTPVFGSPDQQFVTPQTQPAAGVGSMKKSPKTILIAVAAVLALIAGGVAVWLVFFNGMPLKEYSNSDYSILVPESYVQEKSTGSGMDFTKPNTESGYKSQISVTATAIADGDRPHFVTQMKDKFTVESVKSGSYVITNDDITDVKVVDSKRDDMDIKTASGNVSRDGSVIGSFKMALMVAGKKAYTVLIMAHKSEPALAASADKIVDSLKAK